MSDSITMANGVVLRVGDRLPTKSGHTFLLLGIDDDPNDSMPLYVIEVGRGRPWDRSAHWRYQHDIDLPALASPPALTLTEERRREIAEAFQILMDACLPDKVVPPTSPAEAITTMRVALRAAGILGDKP